MIPRYQLVLFYTLCVLIGLMAAFTLYERRKAHDRITASTDAMPYIEPVNAQTESVTLLLAHDADGAILSGLRTAALPHEPSLRARALLERLFAEYRLPNSTHPIKSSPAVDDVFLLKLPLGATVPAVASTPAGAATPAPAADLLAVVNLHGAFADAHPAGMLVETLTLQSIIGTLHANLPEVTQVRFLADGQPRETLAGHADLLRTYPAVDTSATPAQPIEMLQP